VTPEKDAAYAELHRLIGETAWAWADLEGSLTSLLVALLHTPLAAVLTEGQSFETIRQQINAVISVPAHLEKHDVEREPLPADRNAEIVRLLRDAKTLSDERNRVVHGIWDLAGEPGVWVTARPRRYKRLIPIETVTVDRLREVAGQITVTSDTIQTLAEEIDPRFADQPVDD
jgi:hypothetical protein